MTIYTEHPRWVYFLRPVGERGPVKIGCSLRPERRRGELQTIFGSPLEIAAAVPGCVDDEHRIHSLFWHDHIAREWFNWSPLLQILIDAATRCEADLAALPQTRVRRMPDRRWTEERKLQSKSRRLNHGKAA